PAPLGAAPSARRFAASRGGAGVQCPRPWRGALVSGFAGLGLQEPAGRGTVDAQLVAEAAGPLVGAQGVLGAAVEVAVDLVVVEVQLGQAGLEFGHLVAAVATAQHRGRGRAAGALVLLGGLGRLGGAGRRAGGRGRPGRGRGGAGGRRGGGTGGARAR